MESIKHSSDGSRQSVRMEQQGLSDGDTPAAQFMR